jgi:hypothetical protein
LFKWIKQHLRIKTFLGNSQNAVKTQIWIAISAYVLVAIAKKTLGVKATLYTSAIQTLGGAAGASLAETGAHGEPDGDVGSLGLGRGG